MLEYYIAEMFSFSENIGNEVRDLIMFLMSIDIPGQNSTFLPRRKLLQMPRWNELIFFNIYFIFY